MKMHWRIVFGVALALTLALPTIGWTDGNDQEQPIPHAVVDFGQPPPQDTPASATHFLQPVGGEKDGEVTIFKDGTVTFRVNGGGHGVAVYKVQKHTTREDIIGATPDGLCATRSTCVAAFINAAHTLRDAEGNVVLEVGTNPPVARMDDAERILVGTTAIVPIGLGDRDGNKFPDPGIFHQGANCSQTEPPPPTGPSCAALPAGTVARPIGEQIRVKFTKNGRYLVICMNRAHSINDHMFSFVNVVGDDDEN